MEKDNRQISGPEQMDSNREPQRAQRPAPGKVTRTSKLSPSREPVQRKAAAPASGTSAPQARSLWDLTMDPWMDAAHRGVTALAERDQDLAQAAGPIQAKGLHESPEASLRLPGRGSGIEMPEEVRGKMETAFGMDFSSVRIHEGPHVDAVGALAYTQGTDIHFAPGQYQPTSQRGQELLGHELTHVVQQFQGRVQTTTQTKGIDINDDASLEREADELGARAARGERSRQQSSEPIPTPLDGSVGQQAIQEPALNSQFPGLGREDDEHARHTDVSLRGESAEARSEAHASGASGGNQQAVQRTPLPAEVQQMREIAWLMQERIERLHAQYPDARDPHRVEMEALHADSLFDEITELVDQMTAAGQMTQAQWWRLFVINELIGRMEHPQPRPTRPQAGAATSGRQGGADRARPGQYPRYFGPASIDAMRRIEQQVDAWRWVGRLTIATTVISIATSQSGTRPRDIVGNAVTTAVTGDEGIFSILDGGALDVGTQAESLLASNQLARMGIIEIATMTLATETLNIEEERFWTNLLANMPAYRGRGRR